MSSDKPDRLVAIKERCARNDEESEHHAVMYHTVDYAWLIAEVERLRGALRNIQHQALHGSGNIHDVVMLCRRALAAQGVSDVE